MTNWLQEEFLSSWENYPCSVLDFWNLLKPFDMFDITIVVFWIDGFLSLNLLMTPKKIELANKITTVFSISSSLYNDMNTLNAKLLSYK